MHKRYLLILMTVLAFFLAACGSSEETGSSDNQDTAAEEKKKDEGEEKEKKEKKEEKEEKEEKATDEEEASPNGGEVMTDNITEQSEGDVEVLYTNEDPGFKNDMDGFIVSVEKYQVLKVTDMNDDMYIEFDDQNDGYVVVAEVKVNNTKDKAMYYPSFLRLQGMNSTDFLTSSRTFVRDEYPKSEVEEETSKYAAGEEVTGLVTFTMTNDQFDVLQSVKPKLVIEGGAADNSSFSDSYKGNETFDFVYGEQQKEEVEAESNLYPDELTTGNLANKTMIFEEEGIDESKQLGDVQVTLDGVQYAEIEPTAGNEARFSNFGDAGMVALTIKLSLDNQSDQPVSIWNLGSKVNVDDGRASVLSQGMVEPSDPQAVEAGESGEKYHVFLFRKDDFESYGSFQLEFGPFIADDGEKMYKGETVTFDLPR